MLLPAAIEEMVAQRRAFAEWTEPIEFGDRAAVAEQVYQRFFGENAIPFPTFLEMDRSFTESVINQRCGCCGAVDHVLNCQMVQEPFCRYEHDGEEALKPHITEFCPVLHMYCGVCQTVGHHERVHSEGAFKKTSLELRERYFRFMTTGAYTSIPFLIFHELGYQKLSASHWKTSYDGRTFRHAAITRHVMGLGNLEITRMEDRSAHQRENRNWLTGRAQQLELIRQNIEKANTGATVPIPRDFMAKYYNDLAAAELQRRKEQAEHDRQKHAAEQTAQKAAEDQQTAQTKGGTQSRSARRKARRKKLKDYLWGSRRE